MNPGRDLVYVLLTGISTNLASMMGNGELELRRAHFRSAIAGTNALNKFLNSAVVIGPSSIHEFAFRRVVHNLTEDLSTMDDELYGSVRFNDAHRDAEERMKVMFDRLSLYEFVEFPYEATK